MAGVHWAYVQLLVAYLQLQLIVRRCRSSLVTSDKSFFSTHPTTAAYLCVDSQSYVPKHSNTRGRLAEP